MTNTTLTQKRRKGHKAPVTVQVKHTAVSESEILHWLLVEALKDKFKEQEK